MIEGRLVLLFATAAAAAATTTAAFGSVAAALTFLVIVALLLGLGLFGLLLGGGGFDLRFDLVAKVDVARPAFSSSAESSYCLRNSRSSVAVISSWWAIQASVRPWWTQARI